MANPYLNKSYNHKARWLSYFYQFDGIFKLQGLNSILEIGVGSSIVAEILKENGLKVTTMDIEEELNPDIVGDIRKIPFKDESFDAVVSFETLEHLPFEIFSPALKEMRRVSKKYVFISVPDHKRTLLRLSFKIPFLNEKIIQIRIPSFSDKVFWEGHFWEIGMNDYPLRKIRNTIEDSGLKITKDFVPHDCSWTHYFLLEK
jgi:ubiquinone/menaquinone biosynthesis C-methylase UbiE